MISFEEDPLLFFNLYEDFLSYNYDIQNLGNMCSFAVK